jgi:phenylacetate-CoA ligase
MRLNNILLNYYRSFRYNRISKAKLLEIQEVRFRRLLRYAVKNSEFYQDFYRGIDIDRCRLTDLPILTKSVMMDNFDRLVTDSGIKLREIQNWIADKSNYGKLYRGKFLPILTSGSSGEYALVVYDRQALGVIQASLFARHPLLRSRSTPDQIRMLLSRFSGARMRAAVIAVPHGNYGCMFKSAPAFHRLFTKVKMISLFDPIDQIVATLNNFQPTCILSNTFFYGLLAQEQLGGHLKISFRRPMAFLAGGGEPLTAHTKELARKAWGMTIQDDYGAVECYFMGASCKNHGNLHAMIDLCTMEMVDSDHKAVARGTYGEKILITNLANSIQPIIRYEIDDVAGYTSKPCDCGLPFPTLLPIQGRKSDFLYFEKPSGGYERFHPYRLRIPLYYATDLRQYQIVQTARNALVFYYVPQGDAEGVEQNITKTLENAFKQARLESQITLSLKRVKTIRRNERSGKFEIMKSLKPPQDLDSLLDPRTY